MEQQENIKGDVLLKVVDSLLDIRKTLNEIKIDNAKKGVKIENLIDSHKDSIDLLRIHTENEESQQEMFLQKLDDLRKNTVGTTLFYFALSLIVSAGVFLNNQVVDIQRKQSIIEKVIELRK